MEAKGLRLVGHSDLGGHGDGMGLALRNGYLYVAHTGKAPVATSIVDVSDPTAPVVVEQLPRLTGTTSKKVLAVGDVLLQSCERAVQWSGAPHASPLVDAEEWTPGVRILDLAADPEHPKEIGFFTTSGKGTHRMTCPELPLMYVTGSDDGYTDQFLRVVDLSNPAEPVEVGRWWFPGMWTAGGERPRFPEGRRFALHHGVPSGDLLFCGWWDAGLVILDIAEVTSPQFISNVNWGAGESGATHTALPLAGRDLVVVTDEAIKPGRADIEKRVRVLDVADPYSPKLLSTLPLPGGDYWDRGGRYGPHNLAEPRPQTAAETDRVYVTCFNAGLRVYDLTDPAQPRETAYFVPDPPPGEPAAQSNDVTVGANGLIYLTDRVGGGLDILEPV